MKRKPDIQIKQNQNRQILHINNTITTTYLQKCQFFVEKNPIKSIQYFSVRVGVNFNFRILMRAMLIPPLLRDYLLLYSQCSPIQSYL